MQILLVRHAEAVQEDAGLRDDDRYLTLRGRETARGLARLLREERIEADAIVTSPLPRAVQTAELLADGLDFLGAVTVLPAMRPGAHPRLAAEALVGLGRVVIAVGHEPTISALGALLVGRPAFPSFRTAQACSIVDGAPTFTARGDVMQTQALFID